MAMITSDVTFEVLQEINAELLKRVEYKKSLEGGGKIEGKARFEFILFLQRLTELLAEETGCSKEERCSNGACPPCFDATDKQMRGFLNKLKERDLA
jgi:hypothetical protein